MASHTTTHTHSHTSQQNTAVPKLLQTIRHKPGFEKSGRHVTDRCQGRNGSRQRRRAQRQGLEVNTDRQTDRQTRIDEHQRGHQLRRSTRQQQQHKSSTVSNDETRDKTRHVRKEKERKGMSLDESTYTVLTIEKREEREVTRSILVTSSNHNDPDLTR